MKNLISKIAPGYLKVEIIDIGSENIAGMLRVSNDKKDIWAKIIDHHSWNGGEFMDPLQRFFLQFSS